MRERSSGKITITVSRAELVMLQDAVDDANPGSSAAWRALGRRLHALTGEDLPSELVTPGDSRSAGGRVSVRSAQAETSKDATCSGRPSPAFSERAGDHRSGRIHRDRAS
jgi:hypothetical protein